MTRDDIIKMARELDMIDFRDDDSDPHVAQFIDFLVTLVGKAEASAREECAELQGRRPECRKCGAEHRRSGGNDRRAETTGRAGRRVEIK